MMCITRVLSGSDMFSWGMYLNYKRSWFLHNSEHSDRTDINFSPGDRVGVRLDLNRQKLSFFINDQPHGPIAFSQILTGNGSTVRSSCNKSQQSIGSGSIGSGSSGGGSSSGVGVAVGIGGGSIHSQSSENSGGGSGRTKMLYPALSFSHSIKISLITGLPLPTDDSSSEDDDNNINEDHALDVENMMPLSMLKKGGDINHLLEDGISGSDSSFRELIL